MSRRLSLRTTVLSLAVTASILATPSALFAAESANTPPGTPTDLRVGSAPCAETETLVAGPNQTLSALIHDVDRGDSLTTYFEYRLTGGGTATTSVIGGAADTRASVNLTGLAEGHYKWRVRVRDSTGAYGDWAGWCGFRTDSTRPAAPTITSTDYPECVPGACVAHGEPGLAGTFTVNTVDADVTGLRYGWTSPPTSSIPVTPGVSVTLSLAPPKAGTNVLYAEAVDAAGNLGQTTSYTFVVGSPSPPIAGWDLEYMTGWTNDGLTNTVWGGPVLNPTDLTWSADARLIGGSTAAFNGTSTQLATDASILDTSASFGVSAWVRLDDKSVSRDIVGQDGSVNSAFHLGYVASADRWELRFRSADSLDATWIELPSTSVPAIGAWTHLAASYNVSSGEASLFVNGVLEATGTVGTRYATSGAFRVGAAMSQGTITSYWAGDIAEVRVFGRPLVTEDITVGRNGLSPLMRTSMAGSWDFESYTGMDNSEWARDLNLSSTAGFASTPSGTALRTAALGGYADTDGPVLRTDQSFTVSAYATLDSLGSPATVISQDGAGASAFQLRYRPDDNKWCMTLRTSDAQDGQLVSACQSGTATVGMTHLIGVYDRANGQVRLYINGVPAATMTIDATMWQANGPLAVGRSLDPTNINGGYGETFDGQIDDVYAFQGAFTDAQAAALYAAN